MDERGCSRANSLCCKIPWRARLSHWFCAPVSHTWMTSCRHQRQGKEEAFCLLQRNCSGGEHRATWHQVVSKWWASQVRTGMSKNIHERISHCNKLHQCYFKELSQLPPASAASPLIRQRPSISRQDPPPAKIMIHWKLKWWFAFFSSIFKLGYIYWFF